MVISLTGFMGCGKSTWGASLARKMGVPFLDLDNYICDREGRSIPAIFASEGEAGFRKIEQEYLEEVLAQYADAPGKLVLALGGGTVTTPACAKLVREKTFCIWLEASAEELRRNLAGGDGRPMLKARGLEELLREREPLYAAVAARRVLTDGVEPEKMISLLENLIN